MTGRVYRIIGFSILLSLSAIVAMGETEEGTKSWDDYRIITERNIFSRNRTKAVQSSMSRRQTVAVTPEQSYYTLRGITRQSDSFISFLEDSRTMDVEKFRKGESIGEGTISEITLDYISYNSGEETIKVEIGMNLEGQISSSGTDYFFSGFSDYFGGSGSSDTGQSREADESQERDESRSMGGFPDMDESGPTEGFPDMDQSMSRGGFPGMDRFGTTDNNGASSQSDTDSWQQDENSENILERLKERRKKELEE